MSYFKAKTHHLRFRLGLPQTACLDLRGPTSKGCKGTRGEGREGEGGERRRGKRRGRGGKGRAVQ